MLQHQFVVTQRGKHSWQADSINIVEKLHITQSADKIIISARKEVQIRGGGSYVRFNQGGIEHGTNGTFVAHAASHSLIGPQSIDVVQQKAFEQAVPRKYSQQLMVDPGPVEAARRHARGKL